MRLAQLLDLFNPHSLSACQRRFDRLKADFEKYSGDSQQVEVIRNLARLLKEVAALGKLGEPLKDEIHSFLASKNVVIPGSPAQTHKPAEAPAGESLAWHVGQREIQNLDWQHTLRDERKDSEWPGKNGWTGGEF